MKTISLKKHIGKDGMLNINIPVNVKETDVEVVVIIESKTKKFNWDDFFNMTYGCFKDNELTRPEQGDYPRRDSII